MVDETLNNGRPFPLTFKFSVIWVVVIVCCGALAPFLPLAEFDRMDFTNLAAPPGTEVRDVARENGRWVKIWRIYPLGTDTMGRDVLTRIVYGARVSLTVGLVSPLIGLIIGGGLGLLAGYYGGRPGGFITAAMDVILAFPGLVLLLAITYYLGPGLFNIIMALGFLTIPAFYRVARANTLVYSKRDFVTAAKMMGQGDLTVVVWEVLPNIVMPLIVYALLAASYMIVAEGALSFLGLSVPAPTPSWGGMIAEGKEVLEEAPHVSLIPALIMYLTILSFNFIGDTLKSRIDTREGQI